MHVATLFFFFLPACLTLNIMSYNIHAGFDMFNKPSIPQIAQVIKQSGANIVALQEVDIFTKRNPFDMPKNLSELTGMPYYSFEKTIDYQGGQYGICILSKYPILVRASVGNYCIESNCVSLCAL